MNTTNQIRNFLRSTCDFICDIFNWIRCVVRDLCTYISSIIHFFRNFSISDIFAWFWCVVRGLYIYFTAAIFDSCSYISSRIYHVLNFSTSIKVHMLVAGETFRTHETFMQKLKLQIELCNAESSNIILVFCPVVSRIGTDMEAAMARVTEDKPVILVFMHHCHNTSHMTNTTVQPSRSNIVQVVHCVFLENAGLLQCQENEQAVSEVRGMLQKYQQGNGPSTEEIFKSV